MGDPKPETETENETDAKNQTQTQSDLKGSPKKHIQYACEARFSHSGEMNEIFVVYLSGITQRSWMRAKAEMKWNKTKNEWNEIKRGDIKWVCNDKEIKCFLYSSSPYITLLILRGSIDCNILTSDSLFLSFSLQCIGIQISVAIKEVRNRNRMWYRHRAIALTITRCRPQNWARCVCIFFLIFCLVRPTARQKHISSTHIYSAHTHTHSTRARRVCKCAWVSERASRTQHAGKHGLDSVARRSSQRQSWQQQHQYQQQHQHPRQPLRLRASAQPVASHLIRPASYSRFNQSISQSTDQSESESILVSVSAHVTQSIS